MGVTLERVRVSFNHEIFTVPFEGNTDNLHGIDLKMAIETHMGVPVVNQKLRTNEMDVSDAIQLSKTKLQNNGVVELEFVDVGAANTTPPEGGSTNTAPRAASKGNGLPYATMHLSTYTVTSMPIRRGNTASVDADTLLDIATRMVDALPRSDGPNIPPPPPPPPVAPQHTEEANIKSKPIPPPAPTQDLTVVDSRIENAEHYHIINDCSIELAQLTPFNTNKFYVIQVLERQDVDGEFFCFTRWGRAGEDGAFKMDRFPSFVGALHAFQKKYKDKTGNEWDERRHFKHVEGKYVMARSPANSSDTDSNDNQDATIATTKRTENSMLDVLSQSKGDDIVVWPTYSSGAVLMATNGGAGSTMHEVVCIRPTVVRGEPLYFRDVGCVTADGLTAALTTKAGADATTLLDSLAAEVHLSMVRLFTRRLGITDVEPAQLYQRVVDAMRSSSTVEVSCADGGSWSLQWEFTSVGCSLIARVAQERATVEVPKSSNTQEDAPPPEVPGFGSRGGRGMGRGGGGREDWESEFEGFRGGRGGGRGRGGGAFEEWEDDEWLPRGGGRGRGGFRGGYFDADGTEYADYSSRGRGGRGSRGRGGDYWDRPARGRGMRGRGRAGNDGGSY